MAIDPIVGSIIVSLVIAAASLAIAELMRPKPKFEDAKPSGLGDLTFPTAIEGRPIPVVFGSVKAEGPNVIWWGDFRARKIREKIKTGLFSSKRITVGFRYDVGIQLGLCVGQVDEVSKWWVGDTLVASGSVQDGTYVLNSPKLFGGDKFGNGGMQGTLRIHSGSATQSANSYLTSFQSPITPHRHTCYAVWEGGYIGNSTQIKPWKFEIKRFPNTLGLTGGDHIVNGADANPAAVIYELLTDTDWGFGFPATDIDLANFRSVGTTLASEGNGFSFQMDRGLEAVDFLRLLQDQIDGIVFLDQTTGKFKLSLARADYDIDLVPQVQEGSGLIEVKEFSRGLWEETSNQVRIKFVDRDRDYFETHAQAHDLANQRIQGGEIVPVEVAMPGVKDKTLANTIAARELRQRAIPLAKGTLVVDRTFWDVQPNDVLAWTDDNLGFTKLPVRVLRIDYGDLENGRINLSVVQDVFQIDSPFFGEPDSTLWLPPAQEVAELDEGLVIEAPFAISRRDPDDPQNGDRVWCGARKNTGNEVTFRIFQRNDPGTPSGAFSEDSDDVTQFLLIGTLRSAVEPGREDGQATISVDPVDSVADLQAAFVASAQKADVGANLVNLCYIEGSTRAEFIAVTSAVDQGTHVDLNGVWRAMLDTAAGSHSAGDKVYLIFLGGDLNQSAIAPGNNVDVQMRAESFTDSTTAGEATTFSLTMNDRHRRPYPPAMLEVNDVLWEDEASVDAQRPSTSSLDDRGLLLEWIRRDWETFDETEGISTDAASIDPDFPSKHSTRYDVTVTADSSSLLTGLEAFWKLAESGGSTRLDETSNNHDLADNGSVAQEASGKIGAAASFGGTNYLEAAATTELDFGDESFTIAFWVRLDDKSTSYAFLTKWATQGDARQYIVQYQVSSDRFQFVGSSAGSANDLDLKADSFGSPSASTWYFIRVFYDHVNDVAGIQVNNGPIDTTSFSGGFFQSGAKFRMGNFIGSSGTNVNKLNGDLDAAGVWTRLLTDLEVGLLYNDGAGQEHNFPGATLHAPGPNAGEGSSFLSRTDIVKALSGALPTSVDLVISTDHDADGTVRQALQDLEHSFNIGTSVLDDDEFLGVLDDSQPSTDWTGVPDTGTYDFEIGVALSSGDVEARINGGAWSTVVSSGSTTGTLAGVTAGDTIEVRHLETSVPGGRTFLQVDPPTSSAGAYGVLV